MAAPTPKYRRVPGRTANFVSIYRLYEGPDHLLIARTTWFREEYRRFFFRDIQAVIIRATQRQRDYGLAWGALMGTAAFPALLTLLSGIPVVPWVLFAIVGLLGIGFVVNLLRGPTCECSLQTAVQLETLPAVTRLARAEKLLARLRPRIAEAQGTAAGIHPPPAAATVAPASTAQSDLPPVLAPEAPPPS